LYDTNDRDYADELNYIFPELGESEDERIRKEIVRFIQMEVEDEIVGNKWLAWLGKQAERKTPQWMIDFLDSYRRKIGCSLDHDEARDVEGKILCIMQWLENQCQVKESTISQHEIETCKENDDSLTSEDERIRKRLITDFGTIGKKEWGGLEVKDILDWLERQGESSICNIPSKEIILAIWDLGNEWKELTGGSISTEYGTQLKYIQNHWHESEYYLRAMQNEQNHIDKVEPKFEVGDWITNGDYTWKIVEVKPLDYVLQSQDGNVVDDTISHVDEQFHSFTIQDAKDGDVLYINNTMSESIMIYKSFNNGIINKHASYNKFGFEGEHYLTLNDGYITPAIKEQRDTLMKAMVDAGYTFDFEKKELKKIEPKPEENKGNVCGISPNWSEEDEEVFQIAIDTLVEAGQHDSANWLQSLKGRVGCEANCTTIKKWSEEEIEKAAQEWDSKANFNPFYMTMEGDKPTGVKQHITTHKESFKAGVNWILKYGVQPKQEWSEEDEQHIDSLLKRLDSLCKNKFERIRFAISEDREWLKSLRPQNRWKPSDEQMEALWLYAEQNNYDGAVLTSLYNDLKKLKEK
jgi:hypothetical protein